MAMGDRCVETACFVFTPYIILTYIPCLNHTTMKTYHFLLTIALSLAILGCTTQAQESVKQREARSVAAAKVALLDYQPTVFATGPLAAAEEAKLSFKTGGIVARVLVQEGQKVRKGQLLAELRLDEIQAQTEQANLGEEQARITLDNAKLALQLAERDLRNAQGLYQDSVATLEQLENAEVQRDNARNQLEAAEKGLAFRQQGQEVARFNLQYSKIIAPANGTILRQFAEANELVGPGSPVFLFGSRQQAQVLRVAVTDKDVVHLQLGDKAQIKFDAYPGESFAGFVRQIAASADAFSGTYAIEIELERSSKSLLNGFIGSATIATSEQREVLSVPIDALLSADGQEGQLMMVKNGKAEVRSVAIDQIYNEQLLVKSGVEPNETVIVAGASYLEPGDSVKAVFD